MKIYPNNLKLIATNNVNSITDIPLSYVDTQKIDYKISSIIEPEFKNKIKQEMLPYEQVKNSMICLFDKNGNQIDPLELVKHFKRENNEYVFLPYNSTTFNPRTFEYSVTAKKNILYNSKMQYDLKVCMLTDALCNLLMPIFGDAPYKNIAPSNILTNNGSLSYSDFMSGNLKNKDIFFINLNTPTTDELDGEFNPDSILNFKTNVFSFLSSIYATEVTDENREVINSSSQNAGEIKLYDDTDNPVEYKIKKTSIYEEVTLSTSKYFKVPKSTEKVKYHNIFTSTNKVPVLIEERVGKGFIVYSISDLLENVIFKADILYEVMFYIYSKSYSQTKSYREWITDSMPDYIVVNNKLTKKDKFVSQLELHKMFGLKPNEVSPHEINIDKIKFPYVKFTGLNNNYLTFEKDIFETNEVFKDPTKPEGAISIFSSRQNILYFKDYLYKIDDSLEENMKIERIEESNKIKISIKPFRHSSSGIFVKQLQILEIDLSYLDHANNIVQITNEDFYITCKQNEGASYLEIINIRDYTKAKGIILSTIQIRQGEVSTLLYDMRQRGGGLSPYEKDNYDCFDIGHVLGRPYRKAGVSIITLPKRLEAHKEIIEQTVKQYCVAEEYPIILFKEEL